MDAVVVVEQHKNEYYSGAMPHAPLRFASSPSLGFKEINCRSFQSAGGMLPTPLQACNIISPREASPASPRTPSPCTNPHFGNSKHITAAARSAPVSIIVKGSFRDRAYSNDISSEIFSYSERWAGPTYSNSPPPTSLPIPKFSVRPKRTVSLELPGSAKDGEIHPTTRSAPASPARERSPSTGDLSDGDESATKTLRRLLNLNLDDK